MSIEKRLTRIETSLTPKQQVLRWLKEVQPLDISTFLERFTKCPAHDDPKVRISEMAARAVRESLSKQEVTPALAMSAEFEARKQTAFLLSLVFRLWQEAENLCAFCLVALTAERLDRDVQFHACFSHPERLARVRENNAELKDLANPSDVLTRAWLLRETVAEIGKKYYEGHRILLAETESTLNDQIGELQSLLLPDKVALAALEAEIRAQVPREVDAVVTLTEVEVLQRLGRWEAAWELRRRHAGAATERLSSKMPAAPKTS